MAEERVQRRLAAILAADVVGYTRLMEADEIGTHARLKARYIPLVEPKISERGSSRNAFSKYFSMPRNGTCARPD